MNAATIKVTGVERKEGVSAKNNKPWTKFIVHADGDATYTTFDAALATAAHAAVGQHAAITYDTTQYGNDLKSLIVDPSAALVPPEPGPVSPPPQQSNSAAPDWDLIGLHKTRCALWAALLPALASMPFDQAMVTGIALVRGAESDIFHREPAIADEHIPF